MCSSRIGRLVGIVIVLIFVCGWFAAAPQTANADLLYPAGLPTYPDISYFSMEGSSYTYDGSEGTFCLMGFTGSYNYLEGAEIKGADIYPSDYNFVLTGTIVPNLASSTPMDVTNGSITVSGTIPDLGITEESVLLAGEVKQVGYEYVDDYTFYLEFSFTVTESVLATAYGGVGATACATPITVKLDGPDTFTGDFHQSFTCGIGTCGDLHAVPVPEPASVALMFSTVVAGFVVSVWRRSWKRRG